jgi:hypothetical protein
VETNYGADWGDFVSFSAQMKAKARAMGVDLLLVDTGMDITVIDDCIMCCATKLLT